MALRVCDMQGASDVGRQRDANEDSHLVAPPMFVVADGMGGAQAGEVASTTAIGVFQASEGGSGTAEERLTGLVREANRRIYELSRTEESLRGMGTTLTAATLDADGVSVAHVGDSRAYRFRDGVLEQLTHDHSLVAELERSGQISSEDAETHPQRSIITRALGPEADVEVDAHTHKARSGDVYLLCSDGLTGMISDDEVAAILRGEDSLAEAAEALVLAANQSGGKDNITVVLFSVEEGDEGEAATQDTPPADDTIHQGLTADDVQAAVEEQERAGATTPGATTSAQPKAAAPSRQEPPVAPRRRSSVGRVLGALAGILVVAAIGAGAVIGARQIFFVGTNDAGLVTLYRGLPYDLPLGVELYAEQYATSVPARAIGKARRARVLDHEWRSRADAEDLLRQLERGTLDLGTSP